MAIVEVPGGRLAPRSRAGLYLLALIALSGLNLRTLFASLPPLLDEVRDDLGLSATLSGLLTTLPVVALGALAPLAPRLARRVPIEGLLLATNALTALGLGARGLGGAPALFAGTLLAGSAIALSQALVPILVRARHPEAAGLMTGLLSTSLTIGAAIAAGAAVPIDDALGGNWRASLAIWALPAALCAIAWARRARHTATTIAAPPAQRAPHTAVTRSVVVFFGVQSMGFYASLAWLPSILEEDGYAPGSAGALLALMSIASFAPAFAVPVLAARRSRQTGLLIAIAAFTCAGAAGVLADPGRAWVWTVLLGLGQGGSLGLGLILPVLRGGDVHGVAALTASTLAFGYLLASTGPWLLGAVRDVSSDWTAALLVLVAIGAAQLPIGLAAVRGESRG